MDLFPIWLGNNGAGTTLILSPQFRSNYGLDFGYISPLGQPLYDIQPRYTGGSYLDLGVFRCIWKPN